MYRNSGWRTFNWSEIGEKSENCSINLIHLLVPYTSISILWPSGTSSCRYLFYICCSGNFVSNDIDDTANSKRRIFFYLCQKYGPLFGWHFYTFFVSRSPREFRINRNVNCWKQISIFWLTFRRSHLTDSTYLKCPFGFIFNSAHGKQKEDTYFRFVQYCTQTEHTHLVSIVRYWVVLFLK